MANRPRPSSKPRTPARTSTRASTRTPSRPAASRNPPPRTRWSGFRPLFDFWGNEIKRFYKLETFSSATDFLIARGNDRFIVPSVMEVMGPAPVSTLAFELFQEGKFQLIFRMRAANAKRHEATFALVAAKGPKEFSEVAANEHRNLRILHERVPEFVVKPFRGGNIYLPDRHQRTEKGRDVFVYVTQWLSGFHELGIAKNLQFYINTAQPHMFGIAQTEALRGKIIEIVLRTYDPHKGECMDMPQIASGDFVVTHTTESTPRLRLIACRRILKHVTPAKLIHRILSASWEWGGQTFYLVPAEPSILLDAFAAALGKPEARAWLDQYRAAVRAGALPEQEVFPLRALHGTEIGYK